MVRAPSESAEAKALVRWLNGQPQLLFSKLSQETPTTPETAAKNRAEGVRRGVPDYLIVHRRTRRVLFIELKREQGGRVSAEQQVWLMALGRKAHVALGWRDARHLIENWLWDQNHRKLRQTSKRKRG